MRTDGRSVGVRWRDYQIFSDVKITSFLLTRVVRWRASRASSVKTLFFMNLVILVVHVVIV